MAKERDTLLGEQGQDARRRPSWVIPAILAFMALAIGAAFLVSRNLAGSDKNQIAAANGVSGRAQDHARPPVPEKAAPPPAVARAPNDFSAPVNISGGACSFGSTLDHAIDGLIGYAGNPPRGRPGRITLGGRSYVASMTATRDRSIGDPDFRNYDARVRLTAPATWNGLRLTGLRSSAVWEGDAQSLEFAESPARLQATMRTLGISMPLPPDSRDIPQDACSAQIAIESRLHGSALTCSGGC